MANKDSSLLPTREAHANYVRGTQERVDRDEDGNTTGLPSLIDPIPLLYLGTTRVSIGSKDSDNRIRIRR